MKITLDERPMLNIRQIRSQEITHLIMHALRDFIPDDRLSRANDELHKLLHDIGAEIITDQKRAETGLPPRGPDGWTVEELKTLEIKRLRKLIEPHQLLHLQKPRHRGRREDGSQNPEQRPDILRRDAS